MRKMKRQYVCDICGSEYKTDEYELTKNQETYNGSMGFMSSDSVWTIQNRKASEAPMIDKGDYFEKAFVYELLSGADCCEACRAVLDEEAKRVKERIAEMRK